MRTRDRWLVLALLLATTAYALAEDLTLTTYYPSPRGVYAELRTSGNVKIGDISAAAPKARLDVRGSVNLQNANNAAVITFPHTGPFPNFYLRSDDDPTTYEPTSERLFVGGTGNVGIGTASPTSAPSPANGSATGNLDVNDAWIRAANGGAGRWASRGATINYSACFWHPTGLGGFGSIYGYWPPGMWTDLPHMADSRWYPEMCGANEVMVGFASSEHGGLQEHHQIFCCPIN